MSASVLKTVKCGKSITTALIRPKHTLNSGEGRISVEAVGTQQQPHQQMHKVVTAKQTVATASLPAIIPPNVEELQASEKAQFAPRRVRDTSSAHIAAFSGSLFGAGLVNSAQESSYNVGSVPKDTHVDVYDCSDPVSLDSLVQTNVPQPFEISGQAPSQFNLPDCHGALDDKYVAGDLQDHHHNTAISSKKTPGTAMTPLDSSGIKRGMWGVTVPCRAGHFVRHYGSWCYDGRLVTVATCPILNCPNIVHILSNNNISGSGCLCGSEFVRNRFVHTCMTARVQERKVGESKEFETSQGQLTSRQKLQRAVKEYGATVMVFHITMSLASLGICYLLVSSGVDMTGLIKALGINWGGIAGDGATEVNLLAEMGESEVIVHAGAPEGRNMDGCGDGVDVGTKTAAGTATFVMAYAVYKVFAPVRISITLTATPFIVRHLRRIGFLKPPKPKTS